MAELVGGAGETIDIDALAARAAGGNPDADLDADQPDAGAQPDSAPAGGSADADGEMVPKKAFGRIYSESKQKDRLLADKDAEIARLRAQAAVVKPATSAAPQTEVEKGKQFIRETVGPVVAEAVKAAVAPYEARQTVETAKTKLSDFWTANPEYVGFRDQLDTVFMAAVGDGHKPEDVNPETILNALIGQATRTQVASRKALAEVSHARQSKVNDAAGGTTAGHRPPAGSGGQGGQGAAGGKKKFTEMSAAEIEAAYGNEVIWRRGLHDDNDLR